MNRSYFWAIGAIVAVVGFSTPAFAGWGVWQTSAGYCGLFEEGKAKGAEYVKQVENTHATYKDALLRIQELLKAKTCTSKPVQ